jgi:hypothetical protein
MKKAYLHKTLAWQICWGCFGQQMDNPQPLSRKNNFSAENHPTIHFLCSYWKNINITGSPCVVKKTDKTGTGTEAQKNKIENHKIFFGS